MIISFYLIYAYNRKEWPFAKEKKSKDPEEQDSAIFYDVKPEEPAKPLPTWVAVLFILFFIIIFVVSIYTTILRYRIAGQALAKGNVGIGMAALAPEMGEGARRIFGN